MFSSNTNAASGHGAPNIPNIRIVTHNGVSEVVPANAVLRVHDRAQNHTQEITAADLAMTHRLRAPRPDGSFQVGDVRYGFTERPGADGIDLNLPLFAGLVGVWLADGTANSPGIHTCLRDVEAVRSWLAGHGVQVGAIKPAAGQESAGFALPGIRRVLLDMGLLQRSAHKASYYVKNPHIPDMYMDASREDRANLLRGLMAGDGSVTKGGRCIYSTVSERLAKDVHQLVLSLGARATLKARVRKYSRQDGTTPVEYQVSFTPPARAEFVMVTPHQMGRQIRHWKRVADKPSRLTVEHITTAEVTYEPTTHHCGLPIVGWTEGVDIDSLVEAQAQQAMIWVQSCALVEAILAGAADVTTADDHTGDAEVIPLRSVAPDAVA